MKCRRMCPLHQAPEQYFLRYKNFRDISLSDIKLLLEAEADVNRRDEEGKTPLIIVAMKQGSEVDTSECVKLLIESGADVNTSDKNGITPLLASAYPRLETMVLLLNAGADVTAVSSKVYRNGRHRTILFLALRCHFPNNTIRLVLRLGAPVNYRDNFGRNALESAVNRLEYSWFRQDLILVFAPGETLDNTNVPPVPVWLNEVKKRVGVFEYLLELQQSLDLKNLCRQAIRKHLIDLDPRAHLFNRIPKLGLPSLLNEYSIGGSRGAPPVRALPPPTGSISFIFVYVFTKKCMHRRLVPP